MADLYEKNLTKLQQNLLGLLNAHNTSIRELSRCVGISDTAIRFIVKGMTKHPSVGSLEKIASHFDVSIGFLLGEEKLAPPEKLTPKITTQTFNERRVPVLRPAQISGWISNKTGFLRSANLNWIVVDSRVHENAFAVIANYPVKTVFPKGSICLVEPREAYSPGEYVLASVSGHAPAVKQIVWEDGKLWLSSIVSSAPSGDIEGGNKVFGLITEARVIFEGHWVTDFSSNQ